MLSLRRESGNLISGSSRCWDFGGENMRVTNVFVQCGYQIIAMELIWSLGGRPMEWKDIESDQ